MVAIRLAFALFGAFWGTWAVAALDVQRFLGLSAAGLGALVAVTVVGTLVANLAGGVLTERLGVGPAMAASLAAWAASLAVLATVRTPVAWMAVFLVAVATGGLLDVVLNVASTDVLAHRPGRLLRVHAGYNAGALVGAAVTGVVLAAGWSWRWPLVAIAVASAGLGAALARRHRHRAPARPVPAGSRAGLGQALVELRRSRLLGLAAVFALGAMVEGGIGTFGVLYLRERLDVAVLAGAGAYVGGQALAAGTRFLLGGEGGGHRLGGTRAARLGLGVAAVGLVLEVATLQAVPAAVGLALAAVGASTYWPLLSAVANRAAARPGLAVGGVSAAGYLGFLVGPPLVGAVAEGAGLRAGVLVLAAAAAVAASASPMP